MRKGRFGRLFAGSLLAVTVMAPMPGLAAPDRFLSAVPPPPMLNEHRARRHRHAVPIPPLPPSARADRNTIQRDSRRTIHRNAAPLPPPAPTASAPPPPPPNSSCAARSTSSCRRARCRSPRSCAPSSAPTRSTGASIGCPTARRSGASMPRAITRRSGPATVRSASAAKRRSRGCKTPPPMGSIRPIIRCRISVRAPMPRRWPKAISNSPIRCSTSPAIWRSAASRRGAWSSQVEYGDHTPKPADILKTITRARDVNAAFDSYDPPEPGFRALKAKLAELRRANGDDTGNRIPAGPRIKLGAHDARIPALRARLHVRGKPGNTRYDRALYNAIRRLQSNAGLHASGIVDAKTLALINGPTRSQVIDTVAANMERWRWLPRDLGRTYVMVNIPDYTLKVVHDGRTVWRTKIVAGKPTTPTPLVSAPMKQVIVNPSWYVPQSIIQNELLPAYQSDPQHLRPHGAGGEGRAGRPHQCGAAARRRQCARPHQVRLPQQVPGLSARHAGEAAVLLRPPRLQPRLHARAGPDQVRRGDAVAGDGRPHARFAPAQCDVRPGGARSSSWSSSRWCI